MIIVRANARNATYISDDLITSGSVGIPVTFNLSEDFDGLSCIAVFEGSGVSIDVALMGDSCVVPHEVLATAGGYLRIGIYASNSAGTIVIPTVWAGSKMILQGTEPSEVDPSEPTPSWVAQVQEAAAEALQTANNVLDMTVEAETLPAGSEATVEKSVDPDTGAVTLEFGVPRGEQGIQGEHGIPGKSGVYVGAEEPTDPDVNVWIDPDGSPYDFDAGAIAYDSENEYPDGSVGQGINDLKSHVGDLDDLETTDKSNLVAAINEAAQTGGGGGITKTDTGTEMEINAVAGAPESLSVAFEWSQGDVTSISPENPVPITTAEDCTITVNGVDFEQDFTATIGAAGMGAGSWNALTGDAVVTQKAVIVTANMVISLAKVSSSSEIYSAILNLGTPVYADGGGILACSHYKIGSNPGIWLRNGKLYLYGGFANDLEAVKTYVAGLNMTVVFAIETPEQHSFTPKQIALVDGANTISTSTGIMTVTYQVDLQDYIDTAIGEVADVADTALEIADGASDHADALQVDVDTINENLYKYRTETGSNTGTGSASASATLQWGFSLALDSAVNKCRSVTFTPACSNDNTGTYTATRWKNTSGNVLANGETLNKVEEKTANKGESVTFEYLGVDEFVSIIFSVGNTRRTISSDTSVFNTTPLGKIDPTTGVYNTFSGYLSGVFSVTLYKPYAGDSMLLFGKRITLIGDSITEKNGRANVNHGMWLERWTGCAIQNLGVGGTGFARTPGSTNYKTRINRIDANADIIGVAASFNDMIYTLGTPTDTASDDTICGYANEFFDELITLYPTKRVVCYSEGPWYNYKPGVTASDNLMVALKTICEAHGVVWDDGLYRGCALRPWLQANCEVYYKGESGSYTDVVDNIHPNSAGQQIIARWLEKLFEKVVD